MKNNFKNDLANLRTALKDFITSDTDKEVIDKITAMSKYVDTLESGYNELSDSYSGLKDDYITVVKNTTFKSPGEEPEGEKEVTFESMVAEKLQEINKE